MSTSSQIQETREPAGPCLSAAPLPSKLPAVGSEGETAELGCPTEAGLNASFVIFETGRAGTGGGAPREEEKMKGVLCPRKGFWKQGSGLAWECL